MYAKFVAWLQALVAKLPKWALWHGLVPHATIGALLTVVGWFFGVSPSYILFAAALTGLVHEQGDGDLTTVPNAPYEGLLDACTFTVVPLIWWYLATKVL